jgi:hypothetical protein
MAAAGKGSGQGRVRVYKTGVMRRCSNVKDAVQCFRVNRYVDPNKRGIVPAWMCDLCTEGRDPYVPKRGRPGQQKQVKK